MMSAEPVRSGDQDWIKRSEALQRNAWRTFASAATPDLCSTFGIAYEEHGSELYQAARDIPGFSFNKVFSFGVDEAITPERVEDAARWLRERCAPGSMLALPPLQQPAYVGSWLTECSFERHPLDVSVFALSEDVELVTVAPSDVSVHVVTPDEAALFGRTMCDGFGVTPAAAAWPAALVSQPGLTAYLAREGSAVIGAASLFVSGDWGWLFVGSTKPGFRNRGAQTALLSRRLRDGRAAGVRTFNVAAYGPAAGHDASAFASYRNIQRAGFRLAYNRPNYFLTA